MPAAPSPRRWAAAAIAVTLLASGGTACSDTDQPEAATWAAAWADAQDLVPARDSWDAGAPGTEECEAVLVSLRDAKSDLFPAPDDTLATTAEQWFETADGGFFECFGDGDRAAEVDRVYGELDELAAEVDAALGTLDS